MSFFTNFFFQLLLNESIAIVDDISIKATANNDL